jgi:hypothetical protein
MVRHTQAVLAAAVVVLVTAGCRGPRQEHAPSFEGSYETAAHDPSPSPIPDRIVLTWQTDPATSQAVTWRTDTTVAHGTVEIAPAEASPRFTESLEPVEAHTELVETGSGPAHFHSANLQGLTPATRYAYRVGSGEVWSEWFHFRTAGEDSAPFTFIYFGDAQNNILSLWSRTLRSAYADAPTAAFMIHAGDLINRAHRDLEWGEWFEAGDWIQAMVPSIPTPGNHEYAKDDGGVRRLSHLWRPHFTLPVGDIAGLEETVYSVDYQGMRIVSLNSNERIEEQVAWLDRTLRSNPNRWTTVVFHHPVFSTKEGRDNTQLRELWKPLFDRHRVDLVLTGHDHTYGRGRNLPLGVSEVDAGTGTVYVVSVSGPKMYVLDEEAWWDRAAENTQLYQVVSVEGETLRYEARTAVGDLYDAFDLVKREGLPNRMIDRTPKGIPERRHHNTIGGTVLSGP